MKYSQFFSKVLLEQAPLPGDSSSRTYDDAPDAMNNFLDNDTDPDQFLTQGIQQTFDAVQSHFNKKMSEFASTLSPEAIKQMPLGQLREKISDVFKFTNKIQIYSKGKIEQISQDPYAIMAAFLASEPTKMAAFEDLHGNLDDFQQATQDLEGQLASLKGQIDDFVADVEEIDAEQAAGQIEGQMGASDQAPMGRDNMSRGNPSSAGPSSLGMSFSESRKRKRRPILEKINLPENDYNLEFIQYPQSYAPNGYTLHQVMVGGDEFGAFTVNRKNGNVKFAATQMDETLGTTFFNNRRKVRGHKQGNQAPLISLHNKDFPNVEHLYNAIGQALQENWHKDNPQHSKQYIKIPAKGRPPQRQDAFLRKDGF